MKTFPLNRLSLVCFAIFMTAGTSVYSEEAPPQSTQKTGKSQQIDCRSYEKDGKGYPIIKCYIVSTGKEIKEEKEVDKDLTPQEIIEKYAPDDCYNTVVSTGTIVTVSSTGTRTNEKFVKYVNKEKVRWFKKGVTVPGPVSFIHDILSYQNKRGVFYHWDSFYNQPHSSPVLPSTVKGELCCKDTLKELVSSPTTKVANIQTFNGKPALYVETNIGHLYFNLKPFYMLEEYGKDTRGAITQSTITTTGVKINGIVGEENFKKPSQENSKVPKEYEEFFEADKKSNTSSQN